MKKEIVIRFDSTLLTYGVVEESIPYSNQLSEPSVLIKHFIQNPDEELLATGYEGKYDDAQFATQNFEELSKLTDDGEGNFKPSLQGIKRFFIAKDILGENDDQEKLTKQEFNFFLFALRQAGETEDCVSGSFQHQIISALKGIVIDCNISLENQKIHFDEFNQKDKVISLSCDISLLQLDIRTGKQQDAGRLIIKLYIDCAKKEISFSNAEMRIKAENLSEEKIKTLAGYKTETEGTYLFINPWVKSLIEKYDSPIKEKIRDFFSHLPSRFGNEQLKCHLLIAINNKELSDVEKEAIVLTYCGYIDEVQALTEKMADKNRWLKVYVQSMSDRSEQIKNGLCNLVDNDQFTDEEKIDFVKCFLGNHCQLDHLFLNPDEDKLNRLHLISFDLGEYFIRAPGVLPEYRKAWLKVYVQLMPDRPEETKGDLCELIDRDEFTEEEKINLVKFFIGHEYLLERLPFEKLDKTTFNLAKYLTEIAKDYLAQFSEEDRTDMNFVVQSLGEKKEHMVHKTINIESTLEYFEEFIAIEETFVKEVEKYRVGINDYEVITCSDLEHILKELLLVQDDTIIDLDCYLEKLHLEKDSEEFKRAQEANQAALDGGFILYSLMGIVNGNYINHRFSMNDIIQIYHLEGYAKEKFILIDRMYQARSLTRNLRAINDFVKQFSELLNLYQKIFEAQGELSYVGRVEKVQSRLEIIKQTVDNLDYCLLDENDIKKFISGEKTIELSVDQAIMLIAFYPDNVDLIERIQQKFSEDTVSLSPEQQWQLEIAKGCMIGVLCSKPTENFTKLVRFYLNILSNENYTDEEKERVLQSILDVLNLEIDSRLTPHLRDFFTGVLDAAKDDPLKSVILRMLASDETAHQEVITSDVMKDLIFAYCGSKLAFDNLETIFDQLPLQYFGSDTKMFSEALVQRKNFTEFVKNDVVNKLHIIPSDFDQIPLFSSREPYCEAVLDGVESKIKQLSSVSVVRSPAWNNEFSSETSCSEIQALSLIMDKLMQHGLSIELTSKLADGLISKDDLKSSPLNDDQKKQLILFCYRLRAARYFSHENEPSLRDRINNVLSKNIEIADKNNMPDIRERCERLKKQLEEHTPLIYEECLKKIEENDAIDQLTEEQAVALIAIDPSNQKVTNWVRSKYKAKEIKPSPSEIRLDATLGFSNKMKQFYKAELTEIAELLPKAPVEPDESYSILKTRRTRILRRVLEVSGEVNEKSLEAFISKNSEFHTDKPTDRSKIICGEVSLKKNDADTVESFSFDTPYIAEKDEQRRVSVDLSQKKFTLSGGGKPTYFRAAIAAKQCGFKAIRLRDSIPEDEWKQAYIEIRLAGLEVIGLDKKFEQQWKRKELQQSFNLARKSVIKDIEQQKRKSPILGT